jgi:flavodoxin
MMKRLRLITLCLCLLFCLAACNGQTGQEAPTIASNPNGSAPEQESTNSAVPEQEDAAAPQGEPSAVPTDTPAREQVSVNTSQPEPSVTPQNSESVTDNQNVTPTTEQTSNLQSTPTVQPESNETKILIAYFTWAENTHVENPAAVDVDAVTSASVLPPGNTAKMASWIQERVGGDLFSIVVTEPYSSNYDDCLDRAADEKAENARPELVNHVENMDDYDTIFLGYPNWWYTVPMALFTFLEEYDFSGKTVIPFCAHGTGGLASSVRDITAALPDSSEVLETIGVYRPDTDSAQPKINEWLEGLGY